MVFFVPMMIPFQFYPLHLPAQDMKFCTLILSLEQFQSVRQDPFQVCSLKTKPTLHNRTTSFKQKTSCLTQHWLQPSTVQSNLVQLQEEPFRKPSVTDRRDRSSYTGYAVQPYRLHHSSAWVMAFIIGLSVYRQVINNCTARWLTWSDDFIALCT